MFHLEKRCFYLLMAVVSVIHAYPHHQRIDHCSQVRQLYLHHHKHGSTHNQSPMCTHSSTGCCHGLDSAIEQQSRDELSNQLTIISQIDLLDSQYTQLESRIQNKLVCIFNQSDASTHRDARRDEHIVQISNERLLKLVYSYIVSDPNHSENGKIEEHVDKLIGDIFINELQKAHNKKYAPEYVSCLNTFLLEESSLLSTRQLMVRRLYRAIETSRLILKSLELSSSLLERARNIQVDEQCVRQWASTFHCARCNGQMGEEVRPCASLCRHTLANCFRLSHWTLLDTLFRTMDGSLNQLINLVINSFNPETIMASQHMELMKEAREIAVINSERLAKQARVACGPPKRYFRSISMDNTYDYYNYSKTSEEDLMATNNLSLYVLLQSLGHLFSKNKDMFAKFPDESCQTYSNNDCWDGMRMVSTYEESVEPARNETETSIDGNSLSHQIRELGALIDRYSNLRLTRGNHSAMLAVNDDEDYSAIGDDERDGFSDLEDGSGSGDGSGDRSSTNMPDLPQTTQPDLIFEPTYVSNEDVKKVIENPSSIAVKISISNYLVSLTLSVLILFSTFSLENFLLR